MRKAKRSGGASRLIWAGPARLAQPAAPALFWHSARTHIETRFSGHGHARARAAVRESGQIFSHKALDYILPNGGIAGGGNVCGIKDDPRRQTQSGNTAHQRSSLLTFDGNGNGARNFYEHVRHDPFPRATRRAWDTPRIVLSGSRRAALLPLRVAHTR